MRERIIDILVLIAAAWIIVARIFFAEIRFAAVAAAIIVVLQIVRLIQKKA